LELKMQYDSRASIESEVKSILRRSATLNEHQLVQELVDFVLRAYQEGEYDGRKHERRRSE
jgi:hypothetical protein